uniref:Uncharacterized protein n=1 Tax=Neovison vison TaxID=452646 RepID=A0A8C7AB66_NEOVI
MICLEKGLLEAIFVNILVTEVYCKYICIVCIFLFNLMLPSSWLNFFPQIKVIAFTRGNVWITN